MKQEKEQSKSKISLTTEELRLISQVLFNSRWSGQEWNGTIVPLISKIAQIIDEFDKGVK